MRLFIAIPIPDRIKDSLTAMCGGVDGARWRARSQLHLTLRFLGAVDGAQARDVDDILTQIDMPAFTLVLRRTGFFSQRQMARVLWAGVDDDRAVRTLYGKIQHGFTAIGFKPEQRRFHPHVTLARLNGVPVGEAENYAARYSEYLSPPFTVRRYCLYASHLTKDGAIYNEEAAYALALAA